MTRLIYTCDHYATADNVEQVRIRGWFAAENIDPSTVTAVEWDSDVSTNVTLHIVNPVEFNEWTAPETPVEYRTQTGFPGTGHPVNLILLHDFDVAWP